MTERFKPKLTEAQRREIFDEYVKLETASERWGFETRMAEKYSVHRCTIHKITHDPKRVKRYIEGLNHVHDIAMAKLLEAQTDAVCTQVGLMNDVTLPQNLWYLRQNAAVDIMNRAGLKDKTAEDQEIRITFGAESGAPVGAAPGMPPSDDEE